MHNGYYYYYEEPPDGKKKLCGKEAMVENLQKLQNVNIESQTYSKYINIFSALSFQRTSTNYKSCILKWIFMCQMTFMSK